MALGNDVHIEHELFRVLQGLALAGVQRVFLSLLVTGVIVVVVPPVGHRHVGLFDAALDLFEQRLFQRLDVGHGLLGVGVLRLQVGHGVGIVPFP